MIVTDWLQTARRRLEEADHEDAGLSAQVLLSSVLDRPRAWLLAHPEAPIDPLVGSDLQTMLARLVDGTPLPYLTGRQEFYGLDFEVSPDVLIPRPETELLVEQALAWLDGHPGRNRAADVGTGSGCIAITLAALHRTVQVTAVDRSWAALQVTRRNAARHNVEARLHLLRGDLLSAAAGPFDLVCANLPYIPTAVLPGLAVTRHEPHLALDGGTDGLQLIAALLADAPRWMAPGGILLLEIEAGQGESGPNLARHLLPQARVRLVHDLAHQPRLVSIQLHSNE
jgi:release factor glutamine methyltransferase